MHDGDESVMRLWRHRLLEWHVKINGGFFLYYLRGRVVVSLWLGSAFGVLVVLS